MTRMARMMTCVMTRITRTTRIMISDDGGEI